jgi:hypothetical protein
LSAKALLAFLVDDNDALAGVCDLRRCDQPSQSAADHDYVCVISHRFFPPCPLLIQDRRIVRGQRQMVLACGCTATPVAPSCSSLGSIRAEGAAARQHLI